MGLRGLVWGLEMGREVVSTHSESHSYRENFLESNTTLSVTGCEEAREVEAQKHPREFLTPRSPGRRGDEATKGGSGLTGVGAGRGQWLRAESRSQRQACGSEPPEKQLSRKGL